MQQDFRSKIRSRGGVALQQR